MASLDSLTDWLKRLSKFNSFLFEIDNAEQMVKYLLVEHKKVVFGSELIGLSVNCLNAPKLS